MIVGSRQPPNRVDRPAANFARIAVGGSVKSRFDRLHRQRRIDGDARGQRPRLVKQLLMLADPANRRAFLVRR